MEDISPELHRIDPLTNRNDQFNRIVSVLQQLIETESQQFESTVIADEVIDLKLFSEDDEI